MKNFRNILVLTLLIVNSSLLIAQDNIYAVGGRTKVLEWKSAGDYSDYSLLFVAVDANDDRVLQKTLAKSYSNGYTTMSCTLFVSDTEDLTFDASYNYDIAAYGADTLQVRRGLFNLIDPVQTSFNGINLPADGTRFYVAGTFIDSTVADSTLFRYDETTHSIVPIEKDDVAELIFGIPKANIDLALSNGLKLSNTDSVEFARIYVEQSHYSNSRGAITGKENALLLQTALNTGSDELIDNLYEAVKFTADSNYNMASFNIRIKKTGTITNNGTYTGYIYTDNA
ncbi:MAG: hypothetical protein IPL84_03835 [Chitinophagaceae bacterium]|nr:hypothetical protein [Chitinophagaceae bacterium]